MNILKKYIGTREFYLRVFALAIPIMVQNGITNFVSMLDNIMVGRVGTLEMTGVAVANQLFFVFFLCVFGTVSGAGIFVAQFHGNGDTEGIRRTFRFKLISSFLISAIGIGIFLLFGRDLISMYLRGSGENNPADVAAALEFAWQYLLIMLVGLLPYAIVQCYSSTLRETGRPLLPMVAGVIAVITNLVLNTVLIFGKLGAPRLGTNGAAIATVISRFVELLIVSVWTYMKRRDNPFIVGALKSLRVPLSLVRDITIKGMPLMLNETMWSAGIAMLSQCYSERGMAVVSANTICQTFSNVFSTAFMAVGTAIGIILGQMLGADRKDEARSSARKLIAFSVMVSVIVSALFFVASAYIPLMYNTSDEIRMTAHRMMQICAVAMPLDAFANAAYFTLRSGGKTLITILFDSCFVWVVSVPTAYFLSRYTAVSIFVTYAICQGENFIKDVFGFILVKRGIWVKNIVK